MKTTHVDDQNIQQFVFDFANCDKDIIAHVNSCDLCMEIADGYKILSINLKEQEIPALDFNLEDLILEQITNPIEQEQQPKRYAFVAPMVSIVIGITAILSNAVLTELNLIDVDYFIVFVGLFIAIFLSVDTVRMYKSKMQKINFP